MCAEILSLAAQDLDFQNRWCGDVSYKVLTPTFKNLKLLVDCNSEQFVVLMKKYGYKQETGLSPTSDYTHLVYSMMPLDFYLDGEGYGSNTIEFSDIRQHVRFIGKLYNLHPKNALINLHKELGGYFLKSENGVDKFVIRESIGGYAVEISQKGEFYCVDIFHFLK